ncbi:MAG: hypothetical protein R3C11_06620 [Planctomycetaceae bacterium]
MEDRTLLSAIGPAPELEWATQFDGGSSYSFGISQDSSGNVYTVGYFSGTVDFDPGPGTHNLTSAGGRDVFVSKMTSEGQFEWASRIGAGAFDDSWGISVSNSGEVYLSGRFRETVDFDPGAGTQEITSNGGSDVFVLKLDAMGDFEWVHTMGGVDNENNYDLATDSLGNVIIAGNYSGTVDFEPGGWCYQPC